MSYHHVQLDCQPLMEQYQINALSAAAFLMNGCTDKQIQEVLHPRELMPNDAPCLEQIKQRLLQAKTNQEKVFVGGDYDCDGITATTILIRLLTKLGIPNGFYIPNRFTEGYGLNPHTVNLAADKGYGLLLTVDNGVKQKEAIEEAKKRKIDLVITDHHTIEEKLLVPLVHPTLMDEFFSTISGAGVAYEIARALGADDETMLVLAGIATIGDSMQLWGASRVYVQKALGLLNQKSFPALHALIGKEKDITAQDLAFSIVPKLNAIARLKDATNANNVVRYLLSTRKEDIQQGALQINAANQRRKDLTAQMALTSARQVDSDKPLLLIREDTFTEGMIGLLAGRLCGQTGKPTIVCMASSVGVKASARSPEGFDLYTFLQGFQDLFITFGGHAQACAFSLAEKDYETLQTRMLQAMETLPPITSTQEAMILPYRELSREAVESYLKLQPFGQGFREPCFVLEQPPVKRLDIIKGKYPKYTLEKGEEALSFILDPNRAVAHPQGLIVTLGIQVFRGVKRVSMGLKEVE